MTIKQKIVTKELLENGGTMANAMRKAGYSESMVKNPQKLTKAKGFKQVFEELEVNEKYLANLLRDGLNATKVVGTKSIEDGITLQPDYITRLRYIEICLKLIGNDPNKVSIPSNEKLPIPILGGLSSKSRFIN